MSGRFQMPRSQWVAMTPDERAVWLHLYQHIDVVDVHGNRIATVSLVPASKVWP